MADPYGWEFKEIVLQRRINGGSWTTADGSVASGDNVEFRSAWYVMNGWEAIFTAADIEFQRWTGSSWYTMHTAKNLQPGAQLGLEIWMPQWGYYGPFAASGWMDPDTTWRAYIYYDGDYNTDPPIVLDYEGGLPYRATVGTVVPSRTIIAQSGP